MKKLIYLLIAFTIIFSSCGSDDSENPSTNANGTGQNDNGSKNGTTTPDSTAKGDLTKVDKKPQDIRSTETAKSSQVQTKDVEGSKMVQPGSTTSADAKRKSEILTGVGKKPKKPASGAAQRVLIDEVPAAWLLDEVNDIDVTEDPENDIVLFFYEEGEYEVYDIGEDEWDWGYWYIADDGKYLALDLDSEYEWILEIVKLSSNQISLKELGVDTTYTFNAYILGEGEVDEEEFIESDEELAGLLDDNVWEMVGVSINDTAYDSEDLFDLFMFFDTDGEYAFTSQFDPEMLPEVDGGSFEADFEDFVFTFDVGTDEATDFYLIYIDEEFMVLAHEDEDGDYVEYILEAVDLSGLPEAMAEPVVWESIANLEDTIPEAQSIFIHFTEDQNFFIYDSQVTEILDSGSYVLEFNEFDWTSDIDQTTGGGAVVFLNDDYMILYEEGENEEDDDLVTYLAYYEEDLNQTTTVAEIQ